MENKINIHELNGSFFSNSDLARSLNQKGGFGEVIGSKIIYSLYEVLFLIEEKKADLFVEEKAVNFGELIKKHVKKNKTLLQKYLVFKDLRKKGYILKAGLKFGVDFRCYDKGQKPTKDHAKYLVFIINEKEKLDIKDFCSKARVANSTNKILLFAVIDSEEDITYFEINWKRE